MVYLISAILIALMVPLLLRFFSSRFDEVSPTSVFYPKIILVGSAFFIVFFIGVVILSLFDDNDNVILPNWYIFLGVFSTAMLTAGFYLFLRSLNFKLVFEDDMLIHRNIARKTRAYSYAEITRVVVYRWKNSKAIQGYKIYLGKRKITIDSMMLNFDRSDHLIKKGLRKTKKKIEFQFK